MNLHKLSVFLSAAMIATSFAGLCQGAPAPTTTVTAEGLVPVASRDFDQVYLRPNADLAAYRKIIIDQPRVVFQPGWRKSINGTRDVSRWLVPEDERRIAENLTVGLGSVVADVFKTRGYEIVEAPGPGVLRLAPSVTDLFLNAPDVQSPNLTREFSRDTGDATFVLEARDAVTGALVARIVDRATARELRVPINYTTDVSNLFWMGAQFRQWATGSAKQFEAGSNPTRTSSASTTRP